LVGWALPLYEIKRKKYSAELPPKRKKKKQIPKLRKRDGNHRKKQPEKHRVESKPKKQPLVPWGGGTVKKTVWGLRN